MKKWYADSIQDFASVVHVRLAEFANRNRLGPGELIIVKHLPGSDATEVRFLYYAEHECR